MEIISSIPGRVRANVKGLMRNKKMCYIIQNVLIKSKGVFSVKANENTGNVLILYDSKIVTENKIIILLRKSFYHKKEVEIPYFIHKESLLKVLFSTLNPVTLLRRKYSERIYKNEYIISKKIIGASIIISTIIFLFINSINTAISILILGYPGILFTVSITSYYYASVKLKSNNIYLKNNDCLSLLKDTNSLLMENDIFKTNYYKYHPLSPNISRIDMQRLITIGHIPNPVSMYMESIIHEIRVLGISNIFIIENCTDNILDYISYYLGINILNSNNLQKQNNFLVHNENGGIVTLINTNESFNRKEKFLFCDLVVCLYKNAVVNKLNADINLKYDNINKFPEIIKLSQFCEEVKIQTENMSIAFNSLGMLLAVLNYLTPLYSIIFYGMSTLIFTLNLKLRFANSKILTEENFKNYLM